MTDNNNNNNKNNRNERRENDRTSSPDRSGANRSHSSYAAARNNNPAPRASAPSPPQHSIPGRKPNPAASKPAPKSKTDAAPSVRNTERRARPNAQNRSGGKRTDLESAVHSSEKQNVAGSPARSSERRGGSSPAAGGGNGPGRTSSDPRFPEGEGRKKTEPKKKKSLLRKILTVLGTTLLSVFLVVVITGTIVVTALTVYVLEFMDESTDVTIKELESSSNTIVYAEDDDGKLVQLYAVTNEIQRIPVDIEEIPQHVRDAFVAIEDERFYSHEGVDYKRTFAAFANMFMHIYDTQQGGSTITQQLIKNLTGDDDPSPERKIREIFRAMEFEKKYSKDEILEAYLNYIGFGGPRNGIQLASLDYFGKDVSELSIAEAASLAAIPKSPETLYPFAGYEDEDGNWVNTGKAANKERQENVLAHMYSNGFISYDQYQEALNEELIFTDSEEYKAAHPETEEETVTDNQKATSWVVDTALREYAAVLMDEYGIDEQEAIVRINKGGYQIYTTVDMDMQSYVEEKYNDLSNLMDPDSNSTWVDEDGDGEYEQLFPQSAFIAMNYNGEILSVAGGVGEKTESLAFNRATMAKRQPGSCIKPITTYGLALYCDHIHWGSIYKDSPITLDDGKEWPENYDYIWRRTDMFIFEALRQSRNTVPAQLCQQLTPQTVFDFATQNLNVDLVDITESGATDIAYAPLTIGALTYGISPENLVNAYLPYGSGGVYSSAHIVKRVEKGDGTVVYENDGNPHEAVDPETAYVMNHLLREVITSGTGTAAQLSNKTVAGKTGTSEDWNDICFVGLTEDFVSGVWIGYDTKHELNHGLSSAGVWYNIIGEYANSIESDNSYPECDSVIEAPMCSLSGQIATGSCGYGSTGYWKSSNAPYCNNHSSYVKVQPTTENQDESSEEPVPADPGAVQDQPEAPAAETPVEQVPAADPNAAAPVG
ncbi:MAG: transglycosylase domain-containing protein [Porcipelethomonas sp.]